MPPKPGFTCNDLERAIQDGNRKTGALARSLSLSKGTDISRNSVEMALKTRCKHLRPMRGSRKGPTVKFSCDDLEQALRDGDTQTNTLARSLSLLKGTDITTGSVRASFHKRCKHLKPIKDAMEREASRDRIRRGRRLLRDLRRNPVRGLGRFMTATPPAPKPVPWALQGERGAWLTFGLPVAAVLAFLVLSPKE